MFTSWSGGIVAKRTLWPAGLLVRQVRNERYEEGEGAGGLFVPCIGGDQVQLAWSGCHATQRVSGFTRCLFGVPLKAQGYKPLYRGGLANSECVRTLAHVFKRVLRTESALGLNEVPSLHRIGDRSSILWRPEEWTSIVFGVPKRRLPI